MYHVSPIGNLHTEGIKSGVRPNVGRYSSPWVYLGTLDYIFTQYFSYAPKGRYFLYEVNTEGLKLEYPTEGQAKILGNISAQRIRLIKEIHNNGVNPFNR